MDERSGNLQAGALLGLFLEEIGPGVYNKGVADTQQRPQARGMDVHIEVHEDEFDDWRKHDQSGARGTRHAAAPKPGPGPMSQTGFIVRVPPAEAQRCKAFTTPWPVAAASISCWPARRAFRPAPASHPNPLRPSST